MPALKKLLLQLLPSSTHCKSDTISRISWLYLLLVKTLRENAMDRITISEAIEAIDELLQALTNAYWDSSVIQQKDTIFDVVSTLNYERSELAKLSFEDFTMHYEPVTATFLGCFPKFKQLQQHADEWFPRTQTAEQLHSALSSVLTLLSNKCM